MPNINTGLAANFSLHNGITAFSTKKSVEASLPKLLLQSIGNTSD